MPPRTPRRARRALRFSLLAAIFVAIALLSTLAGAYFSVARTLPSLEMEDPATARGTPTKIYDSSPTPVLVAELRGLEDRELLSGDEVPQVMRDAIVAVEDPRFYEHKGMDFLAILRAAWAKGRHREVTAGGSPITQQLIKNAFLTDEQSAADPTLEPTLAYLLESRWTKEKILNEHLNFVYFGSGAYGVQAAARSYFGVSAKDLTLAQAALLAGLPGSPSVYSPRRDPAAALARRHAVLNRMYQQRFISSEELQAALEAPLRLSDAQGDGETEETAWVDLVREQLVARYGSSTVLGGGLRVYVSLDSALQRAARSAVDEMVAETVEPPSVALAAIDPQSGRLVAMMSASRAAGQRLNLVTQGRFRAGSAFLPFVLAAALKQGISPEATYDAGTGLLSLAAAAAGASDEVFARLVAELGSEPVAQTAADAGISLSVADADPAMAIGGPEAGMTPLEMALAYATFASGGERLSARITFDPSKAGYPVTIVRVTDGSGNLIDENGAVETRIMDRGLSELVTSCLRGVPADEHEPATDIGRPAAMMAGVSVDGKGAWFVGYTPELVTAVWAGYPEEAAASSAATGVEFEDTPRVDRAFPAGIWGRFMSVALSGTPVTDFSLAHAGKWVTVEVCTESLLPPTDLCPSAVKRLFRVDEAPADSCRIHAPRSVFMPNVIGTSITRAKKALAEANLKVRTVSDTGSLQPTGVVTRQDHPAGKPVLQGTEILLHVSAGRAVAVPVLAGLTLEEAQARLTSAGLQADVARQASESVPADTVISQSPAAGKVVAKGATVRIVLSSGPSTPPSS